MGTGLAVLSGIGKGGSRGGDAIASEIRRINDIGEEEAAYKRKKARRDQEEQEDRDRLDQAYQVGASAYEGEQQPGAEPIRLSSLSKEQYQGYKQARSLGTERQEEADRQKEDAMLDPEELGMVTNELARQGAYDIEDEETRKTAITETIRYFYPDVKDIPESVYSKPLPSASKNLAKYKAETERLKVIKEFDSLQERFTINGRTKTRANWQKRYEKLVDKINSTPTGDAPAKSVVSERNAIAKVLGIGNTQQEEDPLAQFGFDSKQ